MISARGSCRYFKFHANTTVAAMQIQQLSQYLLIIKITERLSAINRNTELLKIYQTLKKNIYKQLRINLNRNYNILIPMWSGVAA